MGGGEEGKGSVGGGEGVSVYVEETSQNLKLQTSFKKHTLD